MNGGKSAWIKELGAEIAMPPSTLFKPDEAVKLSRWIFALKKEGN